MYVTIKLNAVEALAKHWDTAVEVNLAVVENKTNQVCRHHQHCGPHGCTVDLLVHSPFKHQISGFQAQTDEGADIAFV